MAVTYILPESDGATAADEDGNQWRHITRPDEERCTCYWYWDEPGVGRWVLKGLPCPHNSQEGRLYGCVFEDNDGTYWFDDHNTLTFTLTSWNITAELDAAAWDYPHPPTLPKQTRRFSLEEKIRLQATFGHEPQKIRILSDEDHNDMALGRQAAKYWRLRREMLDDEVRLNEPLRSKPYRDRAAAAAELHHQLVEQGITASVLAEAETLRNDGAFGPQKGRLFVNLGRHNLETFLLGRWLRRRVQEAVGAGVGESSELGELLGW